VIIKYKNTYSYFVIFLKQIELKKDGTCSTIDLKNQHINSRPTNDIVNLPNEVERYLMSQGNNDDKSSSNLVNSANTQNIETKIELLLKSFHIEEKRLNR
jgi:hypothetical protein